MGFKIYQVNPAGVEVIKQFLLENHKRPEEATTDSALSAWAADAAACADINDGEVIVEIPAVDCVHGYAVELNLAESCLDVDVVRESC